MAENWLRNKFRGIKEAIDPHKITEALQNLGTVPRNPTARRYATRPDELPTPKAFASSATARAFIDVGQGMSVNDYTQRLAEAVAPTFDNMSQLEPGWRETTAATLATEAHDKGFFTVGMRPEAETDTASLLMRMGYELGLDGSRTLLHPIVRRLEQNNVIPPGEENIKRRVLSEKVTIKTLDAGADIKYRHR